MCDEDLQQFSYLFIISSSIIISIIIIINTTTAISHMFRRNRFLKVQSYQQLLKENFYGGKISNEWQKTTLHVIDETERSQVTFVIMIKARFPLADFVRTKRLFSRLVYSITQ